jgi:hypothetical protein
LQVLPPLPPQSQTHGGHGRSGAHAGQAQAQPPPDEADWHTPVAHVCPSLHGLPKLNHSHCAIWEERQLASSANCAQGSDGGESSQVHGGQPASLVESHPGHMHAGTRPGGG